MKSRFIFLLKYYCFWLLIFIIQKIIFMAFNFRESAGLNFSDWISVIWHGLRLDLSAGAYIMILPVLILIFLSFFNGKSNLILMKIYTFIILFIVLFLGVVDMNLYSYWGFKLDMTPLLYLKTPKEAIASISFIELGLLTLIFAFLYYLCLILYRNFIAVSLSKVSKRNYLFPVFGILFLGLLFIPIRGGFSIAPLNISSAYFHPNRFANHSAVNVFWNTAYSILEQKKLLSFKFMEEDKAEKLFENFYPESDTTIKVIKNHPNVVIILLESFSNRIIGELGGEKGITPELDKICQNSIVFSNFISTGDRSDKGIVGILSGFPAQPTTSIINYPSKTETLPFLLKTFHDKGYYSSFYYGGNINFANFRSYLTNSSMDRIVTMNDFPSGLNIQKWGVPDEYLFEKILSDIDTIRNPFFIYCFTLSSHDPYDFPMEPFFGNENIDEKSKSAFYYTDKCLGNFINEAKNKSWWDNTLIIILSDHGSRSPGQITNNAKAKFEIPMIWTGGAILNPGTIITKYASQTDIPLTLLNQFGYENSGYRYSKDIFDPASESFAFYFYNNGFGYVSDSTTLIFDNNSQKYVFVDGGTDTIEYQESAKAYLQVLSTDFNSR